MKKTASALLIIFVISASVVLGVPHFKTTSAQSYTVPVISIVYPTNETSFNVAFGDAPDFSFPLIYQTNTVLSWVGYSMDGGSNVTVNGNSTMVKGDLHSGNTVLKLYANDTSGSWAAPQVVSYVVITKSDAISPIISPTLITSILVVLLIVLFSASVLLNLRKRKR